MRYALVMASILVGATACKSTESAGAGEGEATPSAEEMAQQRAENEIAKAVPGAAGEGAVKGDFGVESAKIVYQISGMEEGAVTVWFSGHGETVVVYREMEKPVPEKKHVVWKDGQTTMWKVGEAPYTAKLRTRESELRLVSTLDSGQLEMAGYEKKPNEEIAGQDCEVWHRAASNVTFWRWNGVDLKSINGVVKNGPPTVEAIEVVTPADIPADMIGPPAASSE